MGASDAARRFAHSRLRSRRPIGRNRLVRDRPAGGVDLRGSGMSARIALVHATPVAIEPIASAFQASWPEAEPMNVLDDSLSQDRTRTVDVTPQMIGRFERLARYVVDYGANGVLFTCSAFGPAIEAAARAVPVPVLKPNEAMFDAAL